MIDGNSGVIVGVSGGADSVCLLLLLSKMRSEMGFSLTAVHVEHGIRGEESLGDAAFVGQLCTGLGVNLKKYSVDAPAYSEKTGQSLEEASRRLRYESFLTACRECGADRVAVAHNADDCAETLLFNLVRGSGIRGMSGIRPVSPMPEFDLWEQADPASVQTEAGPADDISVIRPLLNVTREEIRKWLKENGQTWREDSTNTDISYSRNRIRLNIMPEFRRINARAVFHMADLTRQFSEICDFLDEAALIGGQNAYQIVDDAGRGRRIEIYCERFKEIHPVLQKHLLIYLIGEETGSRKDIGSVHVDRMLDLIKGAPGRKISLPYKTEASRGTDSVILYHEPITEAAGEYMHFEIDLAIPGVTVTPSGLIFKTEVLNCMDVSEKIPKKTYTKWFDYDKIKNTVQLRSRRAGDYMQTTADGGHRSLKAYFIDEKIPRDRRDEICLLAAGSQIN